MKMSISQISSGNTDLSNQENYYSKVATKSQSRPISRVTWLHQKCQEIFWIKYCNPSGYNIDFTLEDHGFKNSVYIYKGEKTKIPVIAQTGHYRVERGSQEVHQIQEDNSSFGENQAKTTQIELSVLSKKKRRSDPRGIRNQVEQLLKKILRAFRQDLRAQFYTFTGPKFQKVNRPVVKILVRQFFTGKPNDGINTTQVYQFDDEFFEEHNVTLNSLIRQEYKKKDELQNRIGFLKVLKDVLGARPNKENLKQFFANEAIKTLWFGPEQGLSENQNGVRKGFKYSQQLMNILRDASEDTRMKLVKLFEKVQAPECPILPDF